MSTQEIAKAAGWKPMWTLVFFILLPIVLEIIVAAAVAVVDRLRRG